MNHKLFEDSFSSNPRIDGSDSTGRVDSPISVKHFEREKAGHLIVNKCNEKSICHISIKATSANPINICLQGFCLVEQIVSMIVTIPRE